MREIPILFSTPMVQAILDGRKSMTRRVCKDIAVHDFKWGLDKEPYLGNITLFEKTGLRKWDWVTHENQWLYDMQTAVDESRTCLLNCPYGQPGDRLWVRETWAGLPQFHNLNSEIERYIYKADKDATPLKWKPSIHMPKDAARIWLEVTSVRVERLQDITEEDAKAEGFNDSWDITNNRLFCTARENFEGLWNTLNCKRGYGWDINPWVWVVEFRRVDK